MNQLVGAFPDARINYGPGIRMPGVLEQAGIGVSSFGKRSLGMLSKSLNVRVSSVGEYGFPGEEGVSFDDVLAQAVRNDETCPADALVAYALYLEDFPQGSELYLMHEPVIGMNPGERYALKLYRPSSKLAVHIENISGSFRLKPDHLLLLKKN